MVSGKKTVKRVLAFFLAVLFSSILLLGGVIYFYRNVIIKFSVEAVVMETTGFRTEIQTLHHEFPAKLMLHGVKLYNPPGFKAGIFAASPSFYIEIELPDLWEKKLFHIHVWNLNITEMHLEKNKKGMINGKILKNIKNFVNGEPSSGGEQASFLMDRLDVEIGKITYRDRTGVLRKKISSGLSLPPSTYKDVTDFSGMIDQITEEVLKNVDGPSKIVQLSPFAVENSLKKAAETVKETTTVVTEGTVKVSKMPATITGQLVRATAHEAKRKFKEVEQAAKEQLSGMIGVKH